MIDFDWFVGEGEREKSRLSFQFGSLRLPDVISGDKMCLVLILRALFPPLSPTWRVSDQSVNQSHQSQSVSVLLALHSCS